MKVFTSSTLLEEPTEDLTLYSREASFTTIKRERMKEKIEMESKREERNLVIAVAASIEK